MTINNILNEAIELFEKSNIENPWLNAALLLEEVTGIKHLLLNLYHNKEVTEQQYFQYRIFCGRRANHEPIQHIIGYTEFLDYKIKVSPKVLIPRPETEYLIESVRESVEDKTSIRRIIDIGTGSGVIAISMKKLFPEAEVIAVDISEEALVIAKENAQINQAEIIFKHENIFNSDFGKFDIIISNPPYVTHDEYEILPVEVKQFEPKLALVGDEEGTIFYRKIIELSREHLKPNGYVFFEIGEKQSEILSFLAQKNGFTKFETVKDLVGKDRIFMIKK
jgi:release factor glutamine methyltransferase